MGVMRILKVCPGSFEGSDGKDVTGTYVYLVPVNTRDGSSPERVFLTDEKAAGMEYTPKPGDHVYLFKNGYGRVIDMVRAQGS